jgi:hypothetical protein
MEIPWVVWMMVLKASLLCLVAYYPEAFIIINIPVNKWLTNQWKYKEVCWMGTCNSSREM